MATIKAALPIALGVTLLLVACGGRNAPSAAAGQAGATQNRASGSGDYRAALDAYAASQPVRALKHFRAAAEQGNVNAQYYTGLMYANGEGTKRNFAEAVKWYTQAAKNNQPDALNQLARLYVIGVGVKVDTAQAIELFDKAAAAFPAGEKRDQALQQKKELSAVLDATQKPAPAAHAAGAGYAD